MNSIVQTEHGEWLGQQHERLKQDIIAGCADMAEIYVALEAAYRPLEEEVQRGFDAQNDINSHIC